MRFALRKQAKKLTKVVLTMKVKGLKWYSPFLFLAGAILSVADPITDILTLVEFYCNDHKTLFGVGLLFVILPSLAFLILVTVKEIDGDSPEEDKGDINTRCCVRTIACGLHPFTAAFARIQGFVFSLKKSWRGDDETDEKGDSLLRHIDLIVLFESVLESAPQFIIQLYAINTQQELVQIIQMISLPVSFLSLNWAFVMIDEILWFEERECGDLTLRRKIVIFLTHFFLLSSRLFAVCYFTVAFKWWVIGVLLLHTFMMMIPTTILYFSTGGCEHNDVVFIISFLGLHWLRDDLSLMSNSWKNNLLTVLFSNVLFVMENFVMTLMFYFSQHSNSWFSLPVTVCVCSFSVIGSIMRIAGLYIFNFVRPRTRETGCESKSNSNNNSAPAEMMSNSMNSA